MPKKRATRAFSDELPDLLQERGLSLRALARMIEVGGDHLSRVVRGDRAKKATGELTRRAALALHLPEDYFPEARMEYVIERLRAHPDLRDRVYDQLRKEALRAGRARGRGRQ